MNVGVAVSRLMPVAAAIVVASGLTFAQSMSTTRTLRVCADPNNLPFSNDRGEGFENVLAAMLADSQRAHLEYTWWAQRRGFIRQTLAAEACDVVMGVPQGLDRVDTTRPYYASTYVFVSRGERRLNVQSLDDPRLARLQVGVQMIGDDFANSPPAHALSARGIVSNVRGFSVLGDYARANPPARIVEAVASGDVDVAIVWGPTAGYFARRQRVPLVVTPVAPAADTVTHPLRFAIAMAVRRGDTARRQQLDEFITRYQHAIDRVLARYGVPRAPISNGGTR